MGQTNMNDRLIHDSFRCPDCGELGHYNGTTNEFVWSILIFGEVTCPEGCGRWFMPKKAETETEATIEANAGTVPTAAD